MADAKRIKVTVGVDLAEFRKSMAEVQRGLKRTFGREALDLSKNLAVGMGAVTVALAGLGGASVMTAGQFAMTRRAFESMLGSGKLADKLLRDLAQFAAKTPFEFKGLTDSAKRLVAYGFEADQIVPILRRVGDAAAGVGLNNEGIERITLALGQMQGKGKVSTQEMNQLGETGLKVWPMLAEKIGVSVPAAMKLVEKGAVDANTGISAILEGFDSKFGGTMGKMSGEFPQILSNIADTAFMVFKKIGEDLNKALGINEAMQKAADAFAEFYQTLQSSGLQKALDGLIDPKIQAGIMAVAGAILYGMVPALAVMAANALIAMAPLLPFIAAGAAIGALAYVIVRNWKPIKGFFTEIFLNLKYQAINAFLSIKEALLNFAVIYLQGAEKIYGWIPGFGDKIREATAALKTMRDEIAGNKDENKNNFEKSIKEARDAMKETAEAAKEVNEELNDKLNIPTTTTKAANAVVKETKEIFEGYGNTITDTLTDVVMGTRKASDAFLDLGKQIAQTLIKAMLVKTLTAAMPGLFPSGAAVGTTAIPALAGGGMTNGPTIALIGEKEREIVAPVSKLPQLGMGAANITTNIINQSGQPVSAQTTTQQTADGLIINTVLNALQTNKSGFRTALQAVSKK